MISNNSACMPVVHVLHFLCTYCSYCWNYYSVGRRLPPWVIAVCIDLVTSTRPYVREVPSREIPPIGGTWGWGPIAGTSIVIFIGFCLGFHVQLHTSCEGNVEHTNTNICQFQCPNTKTKSISTTHTKTKYMDIIIRISSPKTGEFWTTPKNNSFFSPYTKTQAF